MAHHSRHRLVPAALALAAASVAGTVDGDTTVSPLPHRWGG